jgi:hypothetical protein
MPSGVFSILPDNFFSPLAALNRQHYAALLVLYYRLFQENTRGLERDYVIREFISYLSLHRSTLTDEADDELNEIEQADETYPTEKSFDTKQIIDADLPPEDWIQQSQAGKKTNDTRAIAGRFLRKLIKAGWLSEETLSDYTRVINITAWGKPFLEALIRVDEGLKTEYESHVVNVYSSLCGETVKENGHFMVLKAREEARALIDSLKVLSQSIKGYYENLNADTIRLKAASALHEHYDLYAGDVLDKAYKRLKTSDNVSRYRRSIYKKISELLHDNEWLNASAGKYMRILQNTREECKQKLILMLEEIRDDLKSVDPLEDEIDKRNADYSRSSTEIIKAYIEPDSTVAGKLGMIIKALHSGDEELRRSLAHGMYRIQFLSPSSLALHKPRDESNFNNQPPQADIDALDGAETEFIDRMNKQHSISRTGAWLDEQGGKDKILTPAEIIKDEDSYIRFVYSLLYGDSRKSFDYSIEEISESNKQAISASNYIVPDIRLRRKHES